MNPIPKRLLPHSSIYKEYLDNNGEGDEWGEDKPLSFIKIEEKTQLKITSNGREVVANARFFYDLVNSSGLSSKPIPNSKIIYNNHEYRVIDTDILCSDQSKPHHYEVMLK